MLRETWTSPPFELLIKMIPSYVPLGDPALKFILIFAVGGRDGIGIGVLWESMLLITSATLPSATRLTLFTFPNVGVATFAKVKVSGLFGDTIFEMLFGDACIISPTCTEPFLKTLILTGKVPVLFGKKPIIVVFDLE